MRILITTTQVPFVSGGAEIHADSLCRAFIERGHEAEIVKIPFKWYPPECIMDSLLSCRLLDISESCGNPVDRVIGLKFPAYHIPHPNKVMWILHQHRSAFDQWGGAYCDLANFPNGKMIRENIQQAERKLLQESVALYANSNTVAKRLKDFCGLEAEPLYHPPRGADKFYCDEAGDYLYYPSRINELKRQSLIIEALALTKQPVRVVFSGKPESPQLMREMLARVERLNLGKRVSWMGVIDEETLLKTYAQSLGVLFPPLDEDYGYITLEAFLSSKPVITCRDSGGPLEFVEHEHQGLVADPNPQSMAQAMDFIWKERSWAREAGASARTKIDALQINWDHVVQRLLA